MGGSFGVDVVQQLKHLFEVETADGLLESSKSNEVEQLTSSDEFKHHVCDFSLSSIRLYLNGRFFEIV
jgi:hypothetical protein